MTKCPICSQRLLPGTDRCPSCGFRTSTRSPGARPEPARDRAPRRQRHSCLPRVLLAVFLLTLLLGAVLRRIPEHRYTAVPEPAASAPVYEDPPVPESAPATESDPMPTASDGACFSIHNGAVIFLPEAWDGSPVLQVPDTVDGQRVIALAPGCFRDCDMLTTILLPESLTRIKRDAFAGCKQLRGLYLPEQVTYIGTDAFSGCTALEAICIGPSVTTIADGCFDDCASLLYIFYSGTFAQWDALYGSYINPYTTAICIDGNYYHGLPD